MICGFNNISRNLLPLNRALLRPTKILNPDSSNSAFLYNSARLEEVCDGSQPQPGLDEWNALINSFRGPVRNRGRTPGRSLRASSRQCGEQNLKEDFNPPEKSEAPRPFANTASGTDCKYETQSKRHSLVFRVYVDPSPSASAELFARLKTSFGGKDQRRLTASETRPTLTRDMACMYARAKFVSF